MDQFEQDFNEFTADMQIGPWGSHANHAADLLGVWIWYGERDSAGQPCRYRMNYVCDKCVVAQDPGELMDGPYEWKLEWSCMVDDDCPRCGRTHSPKEAVDLLLDRELCPNNMEDPDAE